MSLFFSVACYRNILQSLLMKVSSEVLLDTDFAQNYIDVCFACLEDDCCMVYVEATANKDSPRSTQPEGDERSREILWVLCSSVLQGVERSKSSSTLVETT